MTSLLRSIRGPEERLQLDDLIDLFTFQGQPYPLTQSGTLSGGQESVEASFSGFVDGIYKRNGPVFSCMAVRQFVFSEARFQFRRMVAGRPGELFGSPALALLEQPWVNGTTGDLLIKMIQDADLAGNAYVLRLQKRLRRLRPDWVTILVGTKREGGGPDDLDAEVLGYFYQPGGPAGGKDLEFLRPEVVAHFAPIPDPTARYRGMSWLTPVLREIMGDSAATGHKLKFFEQGATPNMFVKFDPKVSIDAMTKFVEAFREDHEGLENAYKTMFLGGGADATVVGSNMKEMSFKETQGAGETRIAAAAGVPPVIAGFSEGLEAATYSNYTQARRRFADGTMRPLWRMAAGALAAITAVPTSAQLWYDDRDIRFLAEDLKDTAEIQQTQSIAMKTLIDAGFEPDSVNMAIRNDDMSLLKHSGLVSVQLQPPGAEQPKTPPALLPAPTS